MKLCRVLLFLIAALTAVGQIANAQQSASQPLTLSVQGAPLVITTTSLSNGVTATPYSKTVAVSGGVTPYTFSISAGALPAGLTIGSTTGVISGTPTTAGTSNFTVRVMDGSGTIDTRAFSSFVIYQMLTFTTTALPTATVGVAYTGNVAFTGGTAPYICSLQTGVLPTGLTLTQSGLACVISGTPSQTGSFSITVRVNDNSQLALLVVDGVLYAAR